VLEKKSDINAGGDECYREYFQGYHIKH
jgi:hypothetical protein